MTVPVVVALLSGSGGLTQPDPDLSACTSTGSFFRLIQRPVALDPMFLQVMAVFARAASFHGANDNDTHCPPDSWTEPTGTGTRTRRPVPPDEKPVEVRYHRSKQEEQGDRE
jgi:hypothetical protein